MGTNYYVNTGSCKEPCSHCSERYMQHLGKLSTGWKFLFRASAEWDIGYAFDEWSRLALSGQIEDEYGAKLNFHKLLTIILERQNGDANSLLPGRGFVEGVFEFSTEDFS